MYRPRLASAIRTYRTASSHWRKCIDAILYLTIFFGRQFLSTREKFVSCGTFDSTQSSIPKNTKIFLSLSLFPIPWLSMRVVVCFLRYGGFHMYFHEWEPTMERKITHFSSNSSKSITSCHFSKTHHHAMQSNNSSSEASSNEQKEKKIYYYGSTKIYGNKTHEWYRRVQKCQTHSLLNILQHNNGNRQRSHRTQGVVRRKRSREREWERRSTEMAFSQMILQNVIN